MHYSLITAAFPDFHSIASTESKTGESSHKELFTEHLTDKPTEGSTEGSTKGSQVSLLQHDACITHILECPECKQELFGKMSVLERIGELGVFILALLLLLLLLKIL